MQDQEKQINKLADLLGNKLDESIQSMIKTLLTGILVETNVDRLKSLTNTLLEKLEANILPTETQNRLIEKILDAVQFIRDGVDWKMHVEDFKWNTDAERLYEVDEVKKADYRWKRAPMHGDPVMLEDTTETIKKSDYISRVSTLNVGAVFNREIKCRGWKPHPVKFMLRIYIDLLPSRLMGAPPS